jgi:hypothetical protein
MRSRRTGRLAAPSPVPGNQMRKRSAAHIFALIALGAGLALSALLPGRAVAATPCWKLVLNDWSKGHAIGVYPLHCYRDAIRNLPEDLRDYSSAADDINAALQAQIAHREDRTTQGIPSAGNSNGNGGNRSATGHDPSPSAYRRAIDNLGTSNADAVPIPLLVLASLGAALLALAATLTVTKRLRALRARKRSS